MRYLKLFENFITNIEDHFLFYIENNQCIKLGNENCPIFKCDPDIIDKIKTRLDNLNIDFEFIDGHFLFPSKEIMNFLDSKLRGLTKFNTDKNNYDYYGKRKDDLLIQDLKGGTIWYKYDGLWSILESKFGLKYYDISKLMLLYSVNHLTLKASSNTFHAFQ